MENQNVVKEMTLWSNMARIAKDRESWRAMVEGYFLQQDTA